MSRKSTAPKFVTPRHVERVEDCTFYHTVDLPGLGLQRGVWDLRHVVDAYIGNADVAGKTVLDVGTGSGFMCFEMEKRGANVIAFDFDAALGEHLHDVVPFHDFEQRAGSTREQFWQRLASGLDSMKNSFWLSHRVLNSKARAIYGDVYDLDADLPVDIVFMGNILLHLASPVQALNNFAPYAREAFIVTEVCQMDVDYESEKPACYLIPDADRRDNPAWFGTWWQLTPAFLKRYLKVLGFRTFEVNFHVPTIGDPPHPYRHFTLVARR